MNCLKKVVSQMLPQRFKVQLRELLNKLKPDESIKESKKKWRQLAAKNANHIVLTNFGENISEEQFSAAGEKDYNLLIKDDLFFRELDPLSTRRILEIGCGTGRMTEFIAEDFHEAYGVDIAEEMIEQAKKRLADKTNTHLLATDGIHLPFPDDFFDAAFSFIVFQHMPSKKVVRKNLEEIVRVLKKGGLAKIQLRGTPTIKGEWFYGPSFTVNQAKKTIEELPIQLLKNEGQGSRYFWIWFRKT
jgi:SAM-dependent methyltransferase